MIFRSSAGAAARIDCDLCIGVTSLQCKYIGYHTDISTNTNHLDMLDIQDITISVPFIITKGIFVDDGCPILALDGLMNTPTRSLQYAVFDGKFCSLLRTQIVFEVSIACKDDIATICVVLIDLLLDVRDCL